MSVGITKLALLSSVAPVLISSWIREDKDSVEVDSELDKPCKPKWGSTHQLDGPLPSPLRAGERTRVSGSSSSKSNDENSEHEVRDEVEAHGQREVRCGRGGRVRL